MKKRILNALPTVLFTIGMVGIFVSDIMAIRDTVKAKEVLERHHVPRNESATIVGFDDETSMPIFDNVVKKPVGQYCMDVAKATWKCYIPTIISTTLTISALVGSKMLDRRTITLISTAAASATGLVGAYREKIREYTDEETLRNIDTDISNEYIEKAHPPVVSTGLVTREDIDLDDDREYLFFDSFTKVKFRSTKLAVLGAKYYLNRNFAIGGNVSLEMFYGFLGLMLPDEYRYCEWDANEIADSGYYWIDIDIVKSTKPDPDSGEEYYILSYLFDPGECENSYYPGNNPINYDGSHAL